MSLSKFVEIAEEQVGNGPETYTSWYGLPGQPWCAMFVSWCANQAGILTEADQKDYPSVLKTASVSAMYKWFQANRRNLIPTAEPGSTNYPQPGDIAFINGTEDHVGIVVSVSGNVVKTVEGNTTMSNGGNGVTFQTYTIGDTQSNWKLTHIGSNSIAY